MPILDAKGRPVTTQVATVMNDYLANYVGKMIMNVDPVLTKEGRGQGIELYEMVLRDDQVASTFQTRKLAAIGKEWDIEAATDDAQSEKIADFVKDAFLAFDLDGARKALMDGIVTGYKPGEVMWEYSEGSVWVKDIIGQPTRRFVYGMDGKLRLRTRTNMMDGEDLPDRKFISFRNVDPDGSPYGSGIGRYLYWPVWFKKNGVKFWLTFADKFGSPTVLGRYPAGSTKEQQEALIAALDAIQQEATVIAPVGMEIEMLEAKRAGKGDTYDRLVEYMDAQVSKIILGHGATADATPGKLGNEQRATQVAAEYTKADSDSMALCLNNTVVKWLVDYNYGPQKAYPKFWARTEPEQDLKPQAERDKILIVDMGLPVTRKYLYDTYGIPEPQKGEDLLETKQAVPAALLPFQQPPGKQGANPFQKGGKEPPGKKQEPVQEQQAFAEPYEAGQEGLEDLLGTLDPEALQKQAKGILKPIIDLINASSNYTEVSNHLLDTFPGMDEDALARMLAKAIAVNDLMGRWEAQKSGK